MDRSEHDQIKDRYVADLRNRIKAAKDALALETDREREMRLMEEKLGLAHSARMKALREQFIKEDELKLNFVRRIGTREFFSWLRLPALEQKAMFGG
jgi:hypothetical protein